MNCECGCGQETTFYRGKYRKYISGHNTIGNNPYFPGKKGSDSHLWKGGRRFDGSYNRIWINGKYIQEHDVIFQLFHMCCLLPNAIVHHINEIKTDNRIENLQGMTRSQHMRVHQEVLLQGN